MSELSVTLPDALIDAVAVRVVQMLGARVADATPEPWLDVKAAAAHLACPPSRVYGLVSQRRIPPSATVAAAVPCVGA